MVAALAAAGWLADRAAADPATLLRKLCALDGEGA